MSGRRPRILFAWELGANYGHVTKVALAAEQLADEAEIFVALRDPVAFRDIAPDLAATVLPAPHARTRQQTPDNRPPANFAAMLTTEGWHATDALAAQVEAWRGVIGLVRPDLLVVQAAPTAALAARTLSLRFAVLGSGYDNPPLADPMPAFDAAAPIDLVRSQEARVVATANAVLERFGAPSVARFRDILEGEASILTTWEVTDHYVARGRLHPDHPPYLGHLPGLDRGAPRDWRGRPGPRIFAYLRPGTPPAAAGLAALMQMGPEADVVLAAPGISDSDRSRLAQRGVQVEAGPVQLARLLSDCDLGISHASNGVGASFLTAGVPQIGLPGHREQGMFARAIAHHGLGLGVEGRYGGDAVVRSIRQALGSERLKNRVGTVAAQLSDRAGVPPQVAVARTLRALVF
ncbi:hypothetical protein OB2597_08644 [Pseudooceanicola batsensis HTCC2597]|uniref:Glycosyltransferase n=1 Tax=Pseudooceanicola batsensis (strain ATCC BAA-863 / DSM 15984 / KCTC 12145 / HTCC2597) TaxID=252305 RepID=A3TUK1_PSEBH|nr:hypothetical protein [Pseudooceanicola batsensis]EAQ04197.1 hypothetical protein OB2597_08644 [Pseudooceanicola batsensis HTCC2597]